MIKIHIQSPNPPNIFRLIFQLLRDAEPVKHQKPEDK